MRGQLGAYEADVVVVVVDTGIDAWYHHRPGRRLTRDSWVMTHVTIISSFLHITGSGKTNNRDVQMGNIKSDTSSDQKLLM